MTALEQVQEMSVYALANLADCQSSGQEAQDFLTGIRDTFVEQYEWARDNDELSSFLEDYAGELHMIADGAVPIYNHDLFATMVGTQAWAEDTSEWGETRDLLQATQIAVYMVADRLVYALANMVRGEGE